MISIDTERKLAEVFLKISLSEGQVENTRFTLCSCEDFDPFSLFRAVDRLGLGSFSSTDMLGILDKSHFFTTNDEVYLSIKQYDTHQSGRLSINEFFQMVLPSTCPGLRTRAQARQGSFNEEVEKLFIKLLQAEVMFHRICENAKKSLLLRHDFSVLECFRAVDIRNLSFIDRKGLMDFLRRHKNVNEIDVDAIFRRVDNDADDILNYQEFVECLMPSQVSTFRSLKVSSTHAGFKGLASQGGNNQSLKNIPQSPSKWSSSISTQKPVSKTLPPGYQSSTFSSSMRKVSSPSPRRASPTKSLRNNTSLKPSSPIRSSNLNISSRSLHKKPLKSQDQSSGRSPLRSSQSRAYTSQDLSQKPESSIISIEEKELVGWFQEEIKINRDVERKKNELSLKHDFNLLDAFRMFDRQGTGYANLNDFQETFEYFNFSAPKDEIFLLIKHFSNSGQLNFKQFSEVISPKQEEYARILRNRSSNDLDLEFPEFSRETLNTFLETFRLLLDAESLAERVRQRLTRMPDFSLYQAFMAVDKGRDGFITIDEFQSVLQSHSIFASTKDLQSLLGKYDKNKDGRVSYTDFIEEITPKSPKRF